jgi:hypothetical protein
MIATMMIHITAERMVKDIQQEFNDAFPFLKIEFFKKNNHSRQQTHKELNLAEHQVIGSVYKSHAKEELYITPTMTVKEVERICEEKFGISAHIYRKAAPNIWIETTAMTDGWTIKQQNDNGSEAFKEVNLR